MFNCDENKLSPKGGCRISRIDKLNEKIANLSGWLDDFSPSSQDLFTKNAVWDEQNNENSETRLSFHDNWSTPSLKNLANAENKKDIEKFAGVYSMKMVFFIKSQCKPRFFIAK